MNPSFHSPSCSLRGILHDDALLQESLPDLIGQAELPGKPQLFPNFQEKIDPRTQKRRQIFGGFIEPQAQGNDHGPKLFPCLGDLFFLFKFPAGLPDQFVQTNEKVD